MTSKKRASMKRHLRWIYPALLRPDGVRVSVAELVGFYREYAAFRSKIIDSAVAPRSLKYSLPPIKRPKYVQWLETLLVDNEEG